MTTTYGFDFDFAGTRSVAPVLPGSTRLRPCSTPRLLSPAPPCASASMRADRALSRPRRHHHHGVVPVHCARGTYQLGAPSHVIARTLVAHPQFSSASRLTVGASGILDLIAMVACASLWLRA